MTADEIKDLLDTEPVVGVSAVSPWEIAVRQPLGNLGGPGPGGPG
jgi:PIN domain nuclease of toxin-antitoxin system